MVSRAAWLYIGSRRGRHRPPRCRAHGATGTGHASARRTRLHGPARPVRSLFLVCDSVKTPLTARQTKWSPSSAATLAAVVLLGPMAAALVGAVSLLSLRRQLRLRRADVQRRDARAVRASPPARVLRRCSAGPVGLTAAARLPAVLVQHRHCAFAAAAAVHVLANHGLIWGIYRLNRGSGMLRREGLESSLPLLLASDFGYACLGLVIASLWAIMGWFAAVLVLVPLFVARWAMGQFAEQQRAYAATMNALCQAVETKDYYTRGHGDRVSRGAVMIARKIRMSSDRTDAIRFAGMLHDVGKLGRADPGAAEDRRRSPRTSTRPSSCIRCAGLEIVREIGFLYEALNGIMHHHERIDGRGYPMGLAGHEIPEFARVIAVADAFDSMTSTRSYREAKSIDDGASTSCARARARSSTR